MPPYSSAKAVPAPFRSDIDRAAAARQWEFGGADYMNHGSFGACPRRVRDFLQQQREDFLTNPMDYFGNENPRRMTEGRLFWAEFLKADSEGVVHVECATLGVNTVMKSLALRGYFRPDDEILLTSHGYNACNNVTREIAALTGARAVVASVPFPIENRDQVTQAIFAAVTPQTRLALIDHITSETGLIFPIEEIVAGLKERGVETLVDGAHAPAHVPLDLAKLGAAFYTGNGHKWLCAAPGAAFLYVREDFRDSIRPMSTSHGANDPNPNLSAFQKTFAWTGTRDNTPYFTPKIAFETLSALHRDGLPALIADNRRLVRYGCQLVLDSLGLKPHAPDDMLGMMTTIILPPGDAARLRHDLRQRENFSMQLGQLSPQFGAGRFLRLSAQAYNQPGQYERLARVLVEALEREKRGDLLPLPQQA
ncbi:MAG: aminotransferase class V-fold PLP-dependent enzyme [Alphaproteobacteria bacterium]|nr:MAG: aminotransferase class V-fold PLP-dependent enzyme [Alphaproteobacteria bacterium]